MTQPDLTPEEIARFWSKVDRPEEPELCWDWTASCQSTGYGQFGIQRDGKMRNLRVHRIAWTLTIGPIPEGLWVLHRCDRRKCCRPSHLFLGDNDANVADMIAKGRHRSAVYCLRGQSHPMAKLTDADVTAIRARRGEGRGVAVKIAAEYGLSPSTIRRILRGSGWHSINSHG